MFNRQRTGNRAWRRQRKADHGHVALQRAPARQLASPSGLASSTITLTWQNSTVVTASDKLDQALALHDPERTS
jgi:hypothetical protein